MSGEDKLLDALELLSDAVQAEKVAAHAKLVAEVKAGKYPKMKGNGLSSDETVIKAIQNRLDKEKAKEEGSSPKKRAKSGGNKGKKSMGPAASKKRKLT